MSENGPCTGYVIDFWGLGFEIAERMRLVPALLERCYLMERLSMVDAGGHEVTGMDVTPMRKRLEGRFISLARAGAHRRRPAAGPTKGGLATRSAI